MENNSHNPNPESVMETPDPNDNTTVDSEPTLADLLEPMRDCIVVLLETKSTRTPSGLFLPEETARSIHEERATQGKIIAVGPMVDEDFEVGDIVLFGKYNGTRIHYQPPAPEGQPRPDKQTVLVMRDDAVLCKLLDPEALKSLKVRG